MRSAHTMFAHTIREIQFCQILNGIKKFVNESHLCGRAGVTWRASVRGVTYPESRVVRSRRTFVCHAAVVVVVATNPRQSRRSRALSAPLPSQPANKYLRGPNKTNQII